MRKAGPFGPAFTTWLSAMTYELGGSLSGRRGAGA